MKRSILVLITLTGFLTAGGNISSIDTQNIPSMETSTFFDNDTGLMWQDSKYTDNEQMAKGDKRSFGKVGKWKYAKRYCQKISFAGYNNWRLPTKEELINVHKKMDTLYNVIDSDYWTSTPVNSKEAWAVYPIAEEAFKHKISDTHYFRCVRNDNGN
jgi:hypothetical protein